MFVRCVRSRSPRPASQPALADLEPSARPPVGVGVAVGVGQAHADALGFALGVALRVVLGIAVTGTDGFAYDVVVSLAGPGAVTVSLAVAPGNVAAVGP